MERIINKLHSQEGESLAETLVALLISVLGITLLAGMIIAGSKIIKSSTDKFKEYVNSEDAIVRRDESAVEKSPGGLSNVYQVQLLADEDTPIRLYKDAEHDYFEVYLYKMKLGNTEIVTFKRK